MYVCEIQSCDVTAVCATYFAAAVGRLVGEHVVVNFCDWRLPGDQRTAVIHFTGCQVQGCVHGCRKEQKKEHLLHLVLLDGKQGMAF